MLFSELPWALSCPQVLPLQGSLRDTCPESLKYDQDSTGSHTTPMSILLGPLSEVALVLASLCWSHSRIGWAVGERRRLSGTFSLWPSLWQWHEGATNPQGLVMPPLATGTLSFQPHSSGQSRSHGQIQSYEIREYTPCL